MGQLQTRGQHLTNGTATSQRTTLEEWNSYKPEDNTRGNGQLQARGQPLRNEAATNQRKTLENGSWLMRKRKNGGYSVNRQAPIYDISFAPIDIIHRSFFLNCKLSGNWHFPLLFKWQQACNHTDYIINSNYIRPPFSYDHLKRWRQTGSDAPAVYVRASTQSCFHSLSTQTFQKFYGGH